MRRRDAMLPFPPLDNIVHRLFERLAARDVSIAGCLARLRPFLPPTDRRSAVVPHDRELMIGQEAKTLSIG